MLAVILVILFAAAYPLTAAGGTDVLIRAVTVIDTEQGTALANRYVLIVDGKIASVADTPPQVSADVEVIDGTGHYLIPGLIDSHVHLAKVPGMNGGHKKKHPELAAAYLRQQPRSYLYFGYTTLIDLNVFAPALIEKFNQEPLHPDVYTAGKHLDIANGHGMFEEDPKTRLTDNPNFLYDHYQNQHLQGDFDLSGHSLSSHSVEATVKNIKDAGAVCIKTYYENGYGGSEVADYDIPTPQIIRDVVAQGHKWGLPTVLHGNSWESYRFALLSGVDIIGHGLWHWGEYRHATQVPDAIRVTLKEIAVRQVGYQATMHVIAAQRDLFDMAYFDDPNLKEVFPVALLQWYQSGEGQWFRTRIRDYFPTHLRQLSLQEMYDHMTPYYQRAGNALKVLSDYGANLLLGTDTIIGQSYANGPGLSGYAEMKSWHEFGVPLEGILKAATINNAKAFNLEDKYGTVETGKVANLLLLSSDPLESIEAYNDIVTVFLRGRVIKRSALSAKM
jgi:imidazolonepropionase-like amidohydrolase